jgi:putative ABC transport system permease protein
MDFLETIRSASTAIVANRMRSSLTILGIVIGVTSVILLVALVSGLKLYITSQIQGLGSNLVIVIPGRIGGSRSPGGIQANKLILQDANTLKTKLSNGSEVSAVIQRTTTLKYINKSDKGAAIFGVQANYPKIIKLTITDGRFFSGSEADSGKRVAVVGTSVVSNLFDGSRDAIGKTIDVGGLRYTIVGILGSRGSTFGLDMDNSIFVPFNAAQRQFGITNVNTIYISAPSSEEVKPTQEKATAILKKRLTEDDFSVQTQEQALSTISQITGVLTIGLGGIAAISLIVGGIGVMNIMLVSVTERTKEIGLRKALGARPQDIRNQFLIEAMTLSGLGGVIGILLGIGLAYAANRFIQTDVTWWSVAMSFSFSMLVGIAFGVAPAIRAARLNPIQALRYE